MSGRPALRRSSVLGLAFGGVLLGHALTYGLLLPDAHARARALSASGHGLLALLERAGLAAALMALGAIFLGRLVRGPELGAGVGTLLGRLAGFQLGAFAAMEIAERLGAGAPLHDLSAVLTVGAGAQVAVALAVALVLLAVLRLADVTAATLVRARSRLRHPVLALAPVGRTAPPRPTTFAVPEGRGPPARS